MKKALVLFFIIGFVSNLNTHAQDKVTSFGIKFSGFVKNDFFWDSRQTVSAREGHFLLWPSAENLDINNVDINAQPNFNFLAIQSRLKGTITGPDAFGAKTSGVIEGDFFSQANDNINLFRLRHAFIKFKWNSTEVMTGQYWNPLFVTACFPGTVSFNTGTPLQSFARNPQIRITQNIGENLSIMVAALSQRDYTSRGPDPKNNATTIVSSEFLRNSAIPDMHLQLIYNTKDATSGNSFLFGTGAAYKTIVPRLFDDNAGNHVVDEKLAGFTAIAFSKLIISPLTFKLQTRYGENTADVLSPSGFAVSQIIDDAGTYIQTYTPLKNMTVWGEVHTNGKRFQLGVFGGYMKNLGTKAPMNDPTYPVYGLATNIASLFRISPRIIFISNKTKIGCEIEYTSTAFGSNFDENYLPGNTTSVANTRLLLSAIYSF